MICCRFCAVWSPLDFRGARRGRVIEPLMEQAGDPHAAPAPLSGVKRGDG